MLLHMTVELCACARAMHCQTTGGTYRDVVQVLQTRTSVVANAFNTRLAGDRPVPVREPSASAQHGRPHALLPLHHTCCVHRSLLLQTHERTTARTVVYMDLSKVIHLVPSPL
jgi:hypothetical protein